MQNRPLVTVVSSFHNCADVAADSIESALAQGYGNIEFVFVDDGSTDGTYDLLSRYRQPGVKLFRFDENLGAGAALQHACANARGEFLAYHEAGDISHSQRVQAQVEALRALPEVGAAASFAEYQDVDGVTLRNNEPDVSGNVQERILQGSIFCHSEMMYRRSVYEAVGGYRPFFRFSQDVDLFLRLAERSRFHVVPEVLVIKRMRRGGVMTDPVKRMQSRYFRSFAEYCSERRIAGAGDPLDIDGEAAFDRRPRTAKLADNLARDAVRLLRAGDAAHARIVARGAAAEKITLRSTVAFALAVGGSLGMTSLRRSGAALTPPGS
jgi:glycosyltransferase involved in cell wall biosynthesis